MTVGLMGKKIGMTQVFVGRDTIPVSVIEVEPNVVISLKTMKKDGYTAIQTGFEKVRDKKKTKHAHVLNKAQKGVLQKAGVDLLKNIKEFRVKDDELNNFKVGQELTVSLFSKDDFVDVSGVSKGKGFSGVIKRHNFSGFPQTHGTHEYFRHGGSIGCRYPQRVIKGTKMPGQMGNKNVTLQNLKVVDIDEENNLLLIKGSIPGAPNKMVIIHPAIKKCKNQQK